MINAVAVSIPSFRGEAGLAGVADALCKINGPRGIGSAAFFNETNRAWSITNKAFHLAADGLGPENTDVGRIWNEGLAFYGWLFYLSKFYEVVDTFIILAKGRKSSFLQTYHHAGAMLCMWAGIRYMSPPIWMFVLVNSGIHAIMYTFYFCTSLGIQIDKRLKRILTTMQITQFVIGASYAFGHLFVAYQIPVSVPYLYHLGDAISSVVSALPSEASTASSSIVASASAAPGAWLKKAALRAAGREGLAENVLNDRGETFGIDAVHIVQDIISREETRFRDELQWVHCLDTSGQVFAILLNCVYLLPLTGLFVRFFVKAYLRQRERRRSSMSEAAAKGLKDASKGFSRQVSEMHGSEGKDPTSGAASSDIKKAVENDLKKAVEKVREAAVKSKEGMENLEIPQTAKNLAEKVQETASRFSENASSTLGDSARGLKEKASSAAQTAKESASAFGEKISELQNQAQEAAKSPSDTDAGESDVPEAEHEPKKGKSDDKESEIASSPVEITHDDAGEPPEASNEEIKQDDSHADDGTTASKEPDTPNESGTGAEGDSKVDKMISSADDKADEILAGAKNKQEDAVNTQKASSSGKPDSDAGSPPGDQEKLPAEDLKPEHITGDSASSSHADAEGTPDAQPDNKADADDSTGEVREGTSFADAAKSAD